MRYKIVSFDNSDGNWTGNPTVRYSQLTRSDAREKILELREAYGATFRYIMQKDK